MALGHIMLDIKGYDLNQIEKEIIMHPQVGGVILFSRNYESKKQLDMLTKSIKKIKPDCLIAVDQEGGRVQRFKNEFQLLPPFKVYGERYMEDKDQALLLAAQTAYQMAVELRNVGVDLSFSPVLDVDVGKSTIIGDRSFHHTPEVIIELGRAFINGMHRAGMPATGKHFPGHGAVVADSHLALPVDQRQFDEIYHHDMLPFLALKTELDAIMPAHILYENVDDSPTCFSQFWLQEVLRTKINFNGVIFSDDLSMAGAMIIVDYVQRAKKALAAGCDMILICNQQEAAIQVLDALEHYHNPESNQRLVNFRKVH